MKLSFPPERPGRNPVTGRFLPGHTPATVRHPDHPNTDHRYKGVRFYYESDFSTW